ncbi:hypothetical protein [Phenylobacterium sp.]|jgi:hypothetical protein|uniref:hypothetical protein n=1 Tax=Phenylobacterium sp. TaxID=1871053 RepID=UPI002F41A717
MRLRAPAAVAVAVLLAGAAAAQQQHATPIASDFEGSTSPPTNAQARIGAARTSPEALQSLEKASAQTRQACAADRERLCAESQSSFSAGRCLERRRPDLSEPCRTAMDQQRMAWAAR